MSTERSVSASDLDKGRLWKWTRSWLSNGAVVAAVIMVLLFVVYAFNQTDVFTPMSMANLLNDTVALAVGAAGLSLVVLNKGFDLSVGGVVVLANVILANYTPDGSAVLAPVVVVLLAGLLVGFINGLIIAYMGVEPIAVTLGTMIMCEGAALVILPAPGGQVPMAIVNGLTGLVWNVIPVAALIFLALIVGWVIFRRTNYATHLYAIGADERAASLAGVNVRVTRLIAYTLAGVIYAVAGIMLSAQTGTGDPTASSSFLLIVFAAVAIGGVSFAGGRGSSLGAIIGAAILTLLQKMLFAIGVSSFYTGVFEGFILIAALLIGRISARIAKEG